MVPQPVCFFTALSEVALVINSSLDTQTVLQKVTEEVAKALNAKACTLRLLDRTGKLLLASASYGLSKGYMRKGSIEVEKSQLDAQLLSTGKPVYINNAQVDSRFQYPSSAMSEGLVSILAAPLLVDQKAIGALRVYAAEEREFTDEEKNFLLAVSHIAAIAIENARLHEALKSNYELLTQYNYQVFED